MTVTEKDLLGLWTLEDWRIDYSDGRPSLYPFGEEATGTILYLDEGYMSASIMRGGRANLSTDNTRKAPDGEKVTAFDDFFTYSGPFRIEGDDVIHHVHHALNPNFVGTDQVRRMNYTGNRLELQATLTTPSGAEMVNRLIWNRAKPR